MSYARARLYLGTSCVGMWVTLSSVALLVGLPQHVLATGSSWSAADVWQLVGVVFLYTFVQGTFDFFGGFFCLKSMGATPPVCPDSSGTGFVVPPCKVWFYSASAWRCLWAHG